MLLFRRAFHGWVVNSDKKVKIMPIYNFKTSLSLSLSVVTMATCMRSCVVPLINFVSSLTLVCHHDNLENRLVRCERTFSGKYEYNFTIPKLEYAILLKLCIFKAYFLLIFIIVFRVRFHFFPGCLFLERKKSRKHE